MLPSALLTVEEHSQGFWRSGLRDSHLGAVTSGAGSRSEWFWLRGVHPERQSTVTSGQATPSVPSLWVLAASGSLESGLRAGRLMKPPSHACGGEGTQAGPLLWDSLSWESFPPWSPRLDPQSQLSLGPWARGYTHTPNGQVAKAQKENISLSSWFGQIFRNYTQNYGNSKDMPGQWLWGHIMWTSLFLKISDLGHSDTEPAQFGKTICGLHSGILHRVRLPAVGLLASHPGVWDPAVSQTPPWSASWPSALSSQTPRFSSPQSLHSPLSHQQDTCKVALPSPSLLWLTTCSLFPLVCRALGAWGLGVCGFLCFQLWEDWPPFWPLNKGLVHRPSLLWDAGSLGSPVTVWALPHALAANSLLPGAQASPWWPCFLPVALPSHSPHGSQERFGNSPFLMSSGPPVLAHREHFHTGPPLPTAPPLCWASAPPWTGPLSYKARSWVPGHSLWAGLTQPEVPSWVSIAAPLQGGLPLSQQPAGFWDLSAHPSPPSDWSTGHVTGWVPPPRPPHTSSFIHPAPRTHRTPSYAVGTRVWAEADAGAFEHNDVHSRLNSQSFLFLFSWWWKN